MLNEDEIKADVLDHIEYICDELAKVEDVEGSSEEVRWRAKGYKEIADKIRSEKVERGLIKGDEDNEEKRNDTR